MLPDGYRGHGPPVKSLIFALLAAVFVALLIPMYLANNDINDEIASSESELVALRQQLIEFRETVDPLESIAAEASQLRTEREAVLGKSSNLADGLELVVGNVSPQLNLSSLVTSDGAITLNGVATNRSSVINYAALLEDQDLFSIVHIGSLTTVASDGDAGLTEVDPEIRTGG